LIYVATTLEVVNTAIFKEIDRNQQPIYFVSRVL